MSTLVGRTFGHWVVLSVRSKGGDSYATLRCCCGTECERHTGALYSGRSKSCGCQRRNHVTHNLSRTKEYVIWKSMRERCNNPNAQHYHDYGGRGIHVCPRWDDYANFLTDMGPRPPKTTLERRNNNLGYAPDNCYWATRTQQARNTRGNRQITHRGITQPLAVWAEQCGIKQATLWVRLYKLNWSVKTALETPIQH